MKLKTTENIWLLGLFLGITGIVSALLLAVVNAKTDAPIQKAKQLAFERNLKQLLPDFEKLGAEWQANMPDGSEAIFYPAEKDGKVIAVFAKASTQKGYAGKIEVLAALDVDGKLIRMMITEDKETPGLGKEVCARKVSRTIKNLFPDTSKLPDNAILDQYNGKDASNWPWKISKDGGEFEFRTGATVTSRAVTELTGDIVKTYTQSRASSGGGR